MYRAVVSGANGHLGQALAAQLIENGVQVHGLTRRDAVGRPAGLSSVQLHRIDGSTEGLVTTLCDIQPDVVFHLAGISRREHQPADIVPFVQTNILFGTQLLEAMRLAGCRRLVLAGSYLQHYDTDGYRAFNLYAATKQALEDIVAFYVDAFYFAAVQLTLSDIYSEFDTRPKLMTDIAKSWATSVPVVLRAEEAWIDPIHVQDAAAACLRAAFLLNEEIVPPSSLRRYSVSSGRDISATELVGLFEELGHRAMTIQRTATSSAYRKIRPRHGEMLPGWNAEISLEQGILRILAQQR